MTGIVMMAAGGALILLTGAGMTAVIRILGRKKKRIREEAYFIYD